MDQHSSNYFSTGKASRLLSVTPDTILKWIKQGKLPAVRTAGGHYRISQEAIDVLLRPAAVLSCSAHPTEGSFPAAEKGLLYCWEFFAEQDTPRPGCHQCLVFRAHALKCFEMNHLSKSTGYNGGSCSSSCENCAYFHYQLGRPFKVLVITDNPLCREALDRPEARSRIQFQFVSCEYECSLVIDRFRPDFAVVDCLMQTEKCRELCHHLANDPRIPDVTIILATPSRRPTLSLPGVIRIRNPISLKELEDHLRRVRVCHTIQGGAISERKEGPESLN